MKTIKSRTRTRHVERLAAAIIDTVTNERRAFTVADGQRAGFTEPEITRFWDEAFAEARRIEPGVTELTVQP